MGTAPNLTLDTKLISSEFKFAINSNPKNGRRTRLYHGIFGMFNIYAGDDSNFGKFGTYCSGPKAGQMATETIRNLVAQTTRQILHTHNFGKKTLDELITVLNENHIEHQFGETLQHRDDGYITVNIDDLQIYTNKNFLKVRRQDTLKLLSRLQTQFARSK